MFTYNTDPLSLDIIKSYLKPNFKDNIIHIYNTTPSTNDLAKSFAKSNSPHGTIILSQEQTSGRGRKGRSFFSPPHGGLYMSLILRPDMSIDDSILITTATSVAICNAISKTTKIETKIKWINDIIYNNKKLGGILVESSNDFVNNKINFIVIGIGLNFSTPLEIFPDELKNKVTSLFDGISSLSKNQLCAEIINEVISTISDIKTINFIDDYKKRSIVLGKSINVITTKDTSFIAKAVDISEEGFLIIQKDDNSIVSLNSADISIRDIT